MAVLRTAVVPSCINVELLATNWRERSSAIRILCSKYRCRLAITVNIDNAIVTDIDNVIFAIIINNGNAILRL